MTVLLAVTAVGAASLLFRLAPLLGAHLMPDHLSRLAAYAGMALLTGLVVRRVVQHDDPAVTAAPDALVAAAALAPALYLAWRGHSALLAIAAAAATYLTLAVVLTAGNGVV